VIASGGAMLAPRAVHAAGHGAEIRKDTTFVSVRCACKSQSLFLYISLSLAPSASRSMRMRTRTCRPERNANTRDGAKAMLPVKRQDMHQASHPGCANPVFCPSESDRAPADTAVCLRLRDRECKHTCTIALPGAHRSCACVRACVHGQLRPASALTSRRRSERGSKAPRKHGRHHSEARHPGQASRRAVLQAGPPSMRRRPLSQFAQLRKLFSEVSYRFFFVL